MVQQVTANAEALRTGIREAGHAAVYGINFDADKAVLRPEPMRRLQRSRSC